MTNIKQKEKQILGWMNKYIPRGKTLPIFEDILADYKQLIRNEVIDECIEVVKDSWTHEGGRRLSKSFQEEQTKAQIVADLIVMKIRGKQENHENNSR